MGLAAAAVAVMEPSPKRRRRIERAALLSAAGPSTLTASRRRNDTGSGSWSGRPFKNYWARPSRWRCLPNRLAARFSLNRTTFYRHFAELAAEMLGTAQQQNQGRQNAPLPGRDEDETSKTLRRLRSENENQAHARERGTVRSGAAIGGVADLSRRRAGSP